MSFYCDLNTFIIVFVGGSGDGSSRVVVVFAVVIYAYIFDAAVERLISF